MTSRVISAERLCELGAAAGHGLGIDTGGPVASLGLINGGRMAAEWSRALPSHGAALPAAVDEVLAVARLKLGDLAGVAVAIGPGSFTGLRVGLSYAKGFVVGARRALVGVPSLDAIALGAGSGLPDDATVCSVIDARRGQVYAALYRVTSDTLDKIGGELVISVAELCAPLSGTVIFVGDAKAQEARALAETRGCQASAKVMTSSASSGSLVAMIGSARIARSDVDNPAVLEPLYVRASDASSKFAVNAGEQGNGTARGRTDQALPQP